MGQGLSPARAQPETHVFWKAQSPTFGEGPKPGQVQSLTFGEGLEKLYFLTAVHSKIPWPIKAQGPVFMEGLKPRPGLGPTLQSTGSAVAQLFWPRPITII